MQAALDLAEGGFRVYLIDSAPAIGGTAARLDKIFPTNDCSMCMLSPRLAECSRHLNVEIITGAELQSLDGEPGRFTARIRQRARFVDLDRCTACGDCVPVCPVRRPDDFNGGLAQRRAIYKLYPQGTPNAFAVERTGTPPCQHACPAGVRGSALAALVRDGRPTDALRLLLADHPFPSACARLCDRRCEAACPRAQTDEPVAVADLVGFVAEQAEPLSPDGREDEQAAKGAGPVAVIGAGPAGLTAAADLARLGSRVVVFEAEPAAGGALRALYAGDAALLARLDREVAAIEALGVEVRLGSPVADPAALLAEGYRAILVATGPATSTGPDAPPMGDDRPAREGEAGAIAQDLARVERRQGWDAEPTDGASPSATGLDSTRTGAERAPEWQPGAGQAPSAESGGALVRVERAPTVVEAIGAGHRAARLVHQYLTGQARAGDRACGDERATPVGVPAPAGGSPAPSPSAGQAGEGASLPPARLSAAEVRAALAAGLASPRARVQASAGKLDADAAVAEAERCLACGGCAGCGECVRACQPGAVDLAMEDREYDLEVGAVVLAMGIGPFDPRVKGEYGFGRYPNVLTSLQFERMLSASGPSGGKLYRPSDGQTPRKIAFVQCVGSRDAACGRGYCSEICCMFVAEEAIIAREHERSVQPTVFYLDIRATGKGFERHVEAARRDHGVRYVRSMVSSVREVPGTRNLRVRYAAETGRPIEEEFDLVVLAMGLGTPESAQEVCRRLGVDLDSHGFPAPGPGSPVATSRAGVFMAGCLAGPKDIPASMVEGSAAAAEVARLLAPARGALARRKVYPPERDVSDEPPRIGVFVCRCGINIGGVVDVPAVAAFARTLPDVVHAEENLYTCSQDTLRRIKARIEELGLNRVVVAACTPRTHEPLYRETIREAGLSPFLFEMVNVREQDSWVHRGEPALATEKAKGLVAMAVARARLLHPVPRQRFDVVAEALVIGGGLAGLTAALALADQGFRTCVVERSDRLGGHLRALRYSLGEPQPPALLANLLERVRAHPDIRIYTRATVQQLGGRVGRFESVIQVEGEAPEEVHVTHGALIVAVGAEAARPSGYFHGEDPRVVTQTEFEQMLAEGPGPWPRRVVMIQCVGSRSAERPYCSKVCCPQAVKNALKLKELSPEAEVFVLYRDLRTGGLLEERYRQAREAGIRFVRYAAERPPEIRRAGSAGVGPEHRPSAGEMPPPRPSPPGRASLAGALEVAVEVAGRPGPIRLPADLVVLSTGVAPGEHGDLAARLKLPLTEDGFFLEAHPKLRPIDFAADGVFLCGLAHSPQTIPDVVAQAKGAAARAAALLSRQALESTGVVAVVDARRCTGCGVCVAVCSYEARRLDEERRVATVEEVLCQGCGACAAACPSGATRQLTLERPQVLAMLEAL